MDIIIELISRSKRLLERHHFTGDSITIGRAYDNDLIISDPHLSEHHAKLSDHDDNDWQIEDLDSKNGIFIRKHQRIHEKTSINSGDEIILGKTHIRIYDRFHKVPDAISMNPIEIIIRPLSNPWNAALLIIFTLLIFAFEGYFDLYVDFEYRYIFRNVMGVTLVGVVWAVIWGFIGRVIRHDARFMVHLVIILVILLCALIFSIFLDLLSFNSSSGTPSFVLGTFGFYFLFFTLIWLSLYLAFSQTDSKRLLTSFGISTSFVAIGLIYNYLNIPEFSPIPEYIYFLKPPALQWIDLVNTETFLKDADIIFKNASAQAGE